MPIIAGTSSNKDPQVPVGSIVAWVGGYFTAAFNGGSYTNVLGATVAAANDYLSENWRVCDGSALNDAESPIFNAAGRFLPDLTGDRFLMGDTIPGQVGGNDTNVLTVSQLPSHNHSMSHTHSIAHDHGTFSTQTDGLHTHSVVNASYRYWNTGNAVGGLNFSEPGTVSLGHNSSLTPGITGTSDIGSVANTGSSHNHSIDSPPYSGNSGPASTSTTGNEGSGAAIENKPQYLGVLFIMRIK